MAHMFKRDGKMALLLQGPDRVGNDLLFEKLERIGFFGINLNVFMGGPPAPKDRREILHWTYEDLVKRLHGNNEGKALAIVGAPNETSLTNGDHCDQVYRILWGFNYCRIIVITVDVSDAILEERRLERAHEFKTTPRPVETMDEPAIFGKQLQEYRRFGSKAPELLKGKTGVIVTSTIDGTQPFDVIFDEIRRKFMRACGEGHLINPTPAPSKSPVEMVERLYA